MTKAPRLILCTLALALPLLLVATWYIDSRVPNPLHEGPMAPLPAPPARAAPNPQRNAYFGELHLHTAVSLDANVFGTRGGPRSAYRFHHGEPVPTLRAMLEELAPEDSCNFAVTASAAEILPECSAIARIDTVQATIAAVGHLLPDVRNIIDIGCCVGLVAFPRMRCGSCGSENPDRAKFCMECGRALAASCGACGAHLPPGARFCVECGVPVSGGAASTGRMFGGPSDGALVASGSPGSAAAGSAARASASTSAPAAAERDPRSYTPGHLIEKILRHRGAIGGERKQVTVLFADIRESMALAERVDVEAWHEIIDGFFHMLSTTSCAGPNA